MIADLREENARLKKLLAEGKIDPATLAALQGANDKKTGNFTKIRKTKKIPKN